MEGVGELSDRINKWWGRFSQNCNETRAFYERASDSKPWFEFLEASTLGALSHDAESALNLCFEFDTDCLNVSSSSDRFVKRMH